MSGFHLVLTAAGRSVESSRDTVFLLDIALAELGKHFADRFIGAGGNHFDATDVLVVARAAAEDFERMPSAETIVRAERNLDQPFTVNRQHATVDLGSDAIDRLMLVEIVRAQHSSHAGDLIAEL